MNKTSTRNKILSKKPTKTQSTMQQSTLTNFYEILAQLCKQLHTRCKRRIYTKYRLNQLVYSRNLINKLIFNEKYRIVAIFKDFLILDDFCEFLKRYYNYNESKPRLQKIIRFYDRNFKIFPNYNALPESKYLYKNIYLKQKLVDKEQENISNKKKNKQEFERIKEPCEKDNDVIFTNSIHKSIQKVKRITPVPINASSLKLQKSLNKSFDNSKLEKMSKMLEQDIVAPKIEDESLVSIKNILNSFEGTNNEIKVPTEQVSTNKVSCIDDVYESNSNNRKLNIYTDHTQHKNELQDCENGSGAYCPIYTEFGSNNSTEKQTPSNKNIQIASKQNDLKKLSQVHYQQEKKNRFLKVTNPTISNHIKNIISQSKSKSRSKEKENEKLKSGDASEISIKKPLLSKKIEIKEKNKGLISNLNNAYLSPLNGTNLSPKESKGLSPKNKEKNGIRPDKNHKILDDLELNNSTYKNMNSGVQDFNNRINLILQTKGVISSGTNCLTGMINEKKVPQSRNYEMIRAHNQKQVNRENIIAMNMEANTYNSLKQSSGSNSHTNSILTGMNFSDKHRNSNNVQISKTNENQTGGDDYNFHNQITNGLQRVYSRNSVIASSNTGATNNTNKTKTIIIKTEQRIVLEDSASCHQKISGKSKSPDERESHAIHTTDANIYNNYNIVNNYKTIIKTNSKESNSKEKEGTPTYKKIIYPRNLGKVMGGLGDRLQKSNKDSEIELISKYLLSSPSVTNLRTLNSRDSSIKSREGALDGGRSHSNKKSLIFNGTTTNNGISSCKKGLTNTLQERLRDKVSPKIISPIGEIEESHTNYEQDHILNKGSKPERDSVVKRVVKPAVILSSYDFTTSKNKFSHLNSEKESQNTSIERNKNFVNLNNLYEKDFNSKMPVPSINPSKQKNREKVSPTPPTNQIKNHSKNLVTQNLYSQIGIDMKLDNKSNSNTPQRTLGSTNTFSKKIENLSSSNSKKVLTPFKGTSVTSGLNNNITPKVNNTKAPSALLGKKK